MDRFSAWIEKDEVRRFRWQPVTKTEWNHVALLAIGISLFYLLPYLYAYFVCPAGKYYLGILENVRDQNSYFMWMKQISQGHFLMKNLYTSTPHEGVLFNLYYFTATLPNLIAGVPLFWCYQIARFFSCAILVYSAFLFSTLFFKTTARRCIVTLGILFGSGLGWLQRWADVINGHSLIFDPANAYIMAVDRWVPEAFANPYNLPFFSAASAMIMLAFFFLARGIFENRPVKTFMSGVLLGIASFVHPYDLVVAYAILCIIFPLIIYECGGLSRRLMVHLLAVGFPSLPPMVFVYLQLNHNPGMNDWFLQNRSTSPHPLAYLIGFCLPLLTACASLFGYFRRHGKLRGPLVICVIWTLVVPFLLYLPVVTFQRRLSIGYMVPLIILSFTGLYHRLDRSKLHHTRETLYVLLFLGIISLHSGYHTLALWRRAVLQQDRFYLDHVQVELLGSLPPTDGTMFATDSTCNYVPRFTGLNTVLGSTQQTGNWHSTNREVNDFYSGVLTGGEMCALLHRLRAAYVYYGPHERQLDLNRAIPVRMKSMGWETAFTSPNREILVFRHGSK